MIKKVENKGKTNKKNTGFSLVELIIVVAILAILVGLLAPQYVKYVEKSKKTADASNMQEILNAIETYELDGSHPLTAVKYEMIIGWTKGGTEVGTAFNEYTANGKPVRDNNLRDELDKTIPNWSSILTKSKKWGDNGQPSAITATIVINSDGNFSISYTPQKFAEFMMKNSKN